MNEVDVLPLEYPITFKCALKNKYLKLDDVLSLDCDEKEPAFPFYPEILDMNQELASVIKQVTICAYCRFCTPIPYAGEE